MILSPHFGHFSFLQLNYKVRYNPDKSHLSDIWFKKKHKAFTQDLVQLSFFSIAWAFSFPLSPFLSLSLSVSPLLSTFLPSCVLLIIL